MPSQLCIVMNESLPIISTSVLHFVLQTPAYWFLEIRMKNRYIFKAGFL